MKHKILPIIALVVFSFATASIVRTQNRVKTNPPPFSPPRSAFVQRVAAAGLIEASSENISIASHIQGVVEKVFVVAGQEVKRGEPILKLDTRALEASKAERQSEVAYRQATVSAIQARARKARAQLADVQRQLRFAESLSDPRSISNEELARRRSAVEIAAAEVEAADTDIVAAKASVLVAESRLKSVETDLARSTVFSPIAGLVLQLRIRPGEQVSIGAGVPPWFILGDVSSLQVRVDIDEHEAWRVRPTAKAMAHVRGNAALSVQLRFVRFEPLVIPKQSLTGASTERVDTRVLQAIYRVENSDLPLFVGQQMDVFIDASDPKTAMNVP